MGRIRPTYIKRVAIELVEKYPKLFTDDFEANKQLVDLKGSDFEDQLEELKLTVEKMLTKMKAIGDYELDAFMAHIGVECGNVVFKAGGFFNMTWKKAEGGKASK